MWSDAVISRTVVSPPQLYCNFAATKYTDDNLSTFWLALHSGTSVAVAYPGCPRKWSLKAMCVYMCLSLTG